MEDPRQELLTLFEEVHKKYELQESDYKTFVETLAKFNRKPQINIEEAKYVRIRFGLVELKTTHCDNCEEECGCEDNYLSTKTFNNIYSVVDEEVCCCDTFHGESGYKISKSLLDRVNIWFDNHYKYQLSNQSVVVIEELEVLE
jgi:hypothetical protein